MATYVAVQMHPAFFSNPPSTQERLVIEKATLDFHGCSSHFGSSQGASAIAEVIEDYARQKKIPARSSQRRPSMAATCEDLGNLECEAGRAIGRNSGTYERGGLNTCERTRYRTFENDGTF